MSDKKYQVRGKNDDCVYDVIEDDFIYYDGKLALQSVLLIDNCGKYYALVFEQFVNNYTRIKTPDDLFSEFITSNNERGMMQITLKDAFIAGMKAKEEK